jgi:hypothetical protein
MPPPPPKPRPLKLEAHILAYFGDCMILFEESLKRTLRQHANLEANTAWPQSRQQGQQGQSVSIHYNGELSPAALKYIASSRNHS